MQFGLVSLNTARYSPEYRQTFPAEAVHAKNTSYPAAFIVAVLISHVGISR